MTTTNLKFNFDRADKFQTDLTKEVDTINLTLNKMERWVRDSRSWWSGGSEEDFIRKFEHLNKKARRELERSLKEYNAIMQEVARAKAEDDSGVSQTLKQSPQTVNLSAGAGMEKSKTLSYTEMRELSSPENVEKRSAERRTKAIEDYRSAYEAHEFWRKEYEKEKNPTTVQEFQKTKQRLEVTIKRLDQLGIDTLSIEARERIDGANVRNEQISDCFEYDWLSIQNENVTEEFLLKVVDISDKLGVKPDDLMAIMASESGFETTRSPNGAVGLIQFTTAGIERLDVTLDDLEKMTALQQLDYVYEFYEPYAREYKDVIDLYTITFSTRKSLLGTPDSQVIYSIGSDGYRWNSGLDFDGTGAITKGDLRRHLNRRLDDFFSQ